MLRRLPRSLRLFSSNNPMKHEFEEHYQYPGNPSHEEFQQWYKNTYHQECTQDKVVFKPKEQIEFNREGEAILYECDVYRVNPIYTPFPHAVPMLWIPYGLYLYLENPLGLLWNWQSMILTSCIAALYPMSEYIWSLRYHINRLTLLRGGTTLKVEYSNLTGNRYLSWIYIDEINLLSKDKVYKLPDKGSDYKVIGDDGNLVHNTFIQVAHFVDIGRNQEDCILTLNKQAKVHNPELLSAVLRAFEVETGNFRINTLHTERWFEPTTNI
jgi:hypothetical protein